MRLLIGQVHHQRFFYYRLTLIGYQIPNYLDGLVLNDWSPVELEFRAIDKNDGELLEHLGMEPYIIRLRDLV